VGNEKLNQHIIQLSISWVLALHSKDYKLNETGGCLGVRVLGCVPWGACLGVLFAARNRGCGKEAVSCTGSSTGMYAGSNVRCRSG